MSCSRISLFILVIGLTGSGAAGQVLRVAYDSPAQDPDGSTWPLAYPYLRDALDDVTKDTGTHTASSGADTLTDSTKSWTDDELIGLRVYNITDGSSAIITDNTDTTVTADLSDDGDWDLNDAYKIVYTQIWVKRGAPYYPDDGDSVTQGEDGETFQLASGLEIYGGFAGGEDTFDDRPQPYSDKPETLTILSGDIDHDPSDTNNSDHVVTGSDTDSTAVLDGFLITKGYAVGASHAHGGGLIIGGDLVCSPHASNGDPVIRNCRFEDNKAYTGGGAGVLQGDPTLEGCYFKNNVAQAWGGAINSSGGDCDIIGNNGPQYGDSKIIDCIFEGNQATGTSSGHGAGAISGGNSAPQIIGCSFFANKAGQTGQNSQAVAGAIWSTTNGGAPGATNGTLIANCVFSGNRSYYDGGAIYTDCPPDGSEPNLVEVINCSFSENKATNQGARTTAKAAGFGCGTAT